MESSKPASTVESAASTPPSKAAESKGQELPPTTSKVESSMKLRLEDPTPPRVVDPGFGQLAADSTAAGNQAYTIELKEQGHLGLFLKRNKTTPQPRFVTIEPAPFYHGAQNTIFLALARLLRLKSELNDQEVVSRADSLAQSLAQGCSLMAYLKIRAIILTDGQEKYASNNLRRPKVSADLPIPAPFAYAIQQLGAVNVADLTTDLRIIPCFPALGHAYGIPTTRNWDPSAYTQAMEYAKSLGMRFAIVDLKVKNGSPWWLYRQVYEEEVFQLECIIPEVNYTLATAVTHSLYLNGTSVDPSRPFADLTSFGTANYGIMLTSPHHGINLSTFEALSDTGSDIWTNV